MTNKFPRIRAVLGDLRSDTGAVSTIEFALILPIFITMGLTGVEVAYMSTVNMQVSQTAISLADNASRLGQTDNSAVTPTVTEIDIDSVMAGALKQGESFDLEENGRIILSSLELDDETGQQYIHWQRCRGDLDRESSYGEGNEENIRFDRPKDTVAGVGSDGDLITAAPDSAVMVAEVYYEYDGIINGVFGRDAEFRQEAIFTIRDDRDLSEVTIGSPGYTSESSCS